MAYIQDTPIEETAFLTEVLLADTITFTSAIIDVSGYTQVQTEILSSHDGQIDISFCSDSAGLEVIRSLSIPYTAANGYQFFAAPAFVNFIKYEFTNTSGSTQTTFYYTTKITKAAISSQLLTTDAFVSPSMVTSLNRSILVGTDADDVFHNVHTTKGGNLAVAITDASLGFNAVVTAGGGLKTNEGTHLVGEPFGGAALNTTEWDTAIVGSGTQDASIPGELTMDTGVTADSSMMIGSADVARFIPANYNTTHHAITIPDGASYATNNHRKWGAITATDMVNCNGLYFELDSGVWYVAHCKNGVATRTAQSSWNGNQAANFPTNSITANVYEIEYNAGSAIFRVNNNVVHRFNLTAAPFADNVHFPVGMCNVNKNGSTTDVSLKVRAAAIYTLGKGRGQDRPFYISGTEAGTAVKSQAGHLGRVIFSRTGSGNGDAEVLIYDALSATNQIGRLAIGGDNVHEINYDITFNIGLFIVVTGNGTLGTTITFD